MANIRNITNRQDTKYTKVPMLEKNDYVLYKNGHAVGRFSNRDCWDVTVQHRTSSLVRERHACIDLNGILQTVLAGMQLVLGWWQKKTVTKHTKLFFFFVFFFSATQQIGLQSRLLRRVFVFGSLDINNTSTFHLKIYNFIFKKHVWW